MKINIYVIYCMVIRFVIVSSKENKKEESTGQHVLEVITNYVKDLIVNIFQVNALTASDDECTNHFVIETMSKCDLYVNREGNGIYEIGYDDLCTSACCNALLLPTNCEEDQYIAYGQNIGLIKEQQELTCNETYSCNIDSPCLWSDQHVSSPCNTASSLLNDTYYENYCTTYETLDRYCTYYNSTLLDIGTCVKNYTDYGSINVPCFELIRTILLSDLPDGYTDENQDLYNYLTRYCTLFTYDKVLNLYKVHHCFLQEINIILTKNIYRIISATICIFIYLIMLFRIYKNESKYTMQKYNLIP